MALAGCSADEAILQDLKPSEVVHIKDIDHVDDKISNLHALLHVCSHSENSHHAQLAKDIAGTTPTQSNAPFRFLSLSSSSSKMTATSPSPQRSAVSPSSSPRLPSPPPFTEVQIGPKSPTIGDGPENQLREAAKQDDGATRRIRPGTKAADMASGPPLIPLADLESPFQLQEHLKALYHTHTCGSNDTTTPITRQTALTLAEPPPGIDRPLWLYELCRFLTMKANNLIIAFFADAPSCSASTCPEMRASEWQYLCAVHDPPKSCCAIDYCCHTLDWAVNVLTSPKYFPSRLTLGGDMGGGGSGGGSQASMRHLTNVFRRVYRIFAHAWFQHRGVFWQVEGHEGLYIFFKTVCDVYQLIPEDNYTIPTEAEGEGTDGESMETPVGKTSPEIGRVTLLQNDGESGQGHVGANDDGEATTTVSVGATTRRHKHTPSTGSHVTTIAEGPEEEEPVSRDGQVNTTSEQPEPPRGRPVLSGEDRMTNGLEKLSLTDLSTGKSEGSAGQPTPQPQAEEKDPMDDFGKADVYTVITKATAAEDGTESGKEEMTKQSSETDKEFELTSVTLESSMEKALEGDGKPEEDREEEEEHDEQDGDRGGSEEVKDSQEEQAKEQASAKS